MTNELLEVVNRVLKATFGETAPVAKLDTAREGRLPEYIIVEHFSIRATPITVDSIRGETEVLGFCLEAGEDATEVFANRCFGEVVTALVENIAAWRAEMALESIGLDEYVRQLAEDQRLAEMYYEELRLEKEAKRNRPISAENIVEYVKSFQTYKPGPDFEGPLRPGNG